MLASVYSNRPVGYVMYLKKDFFRQLLQQFKAHFRVPKEGNKKT